MSQALDPEQAPELVTEEDFINEYDINDLLENYTPDSSGTEGRAAGFLELYTRHVLKRYNTHSLWAKFNALLVLNTISHSVTHTSDKGKVKPNLGGLAVAPSGQNKDNPVTHIERPVLEKTEELIVAELSASTQPEINDINEFAERLDIRKKAEGKTRELLDEIEETERRKRAAIKKLNMVVNPVFNPSIGSDFTEPGLIEILKDRPNGIMIDTEFQTMLQAEGFGNYRHDTLNTISRLLDGRLTGRQTKGCKETAKNLCVSFQSSITPDTLFETMKPSFFLKGTGERLNYIFWKLQKVPLSEIPTDTEISELEAKLSPTVNCKNGKPVQDEEIEEYNNQLASMMKNYYINLRKMEDAGISPVIIVERDTIAKHEMAVYIAKLTNEGNLLIGKDYSSLYGLFLHRQIHKFYKILIGIVMSGRFDFFSEPRDISELEAHKIMIVTEDQIRRAIAFSDALLASFKSLLNEWMRKSQQKESVIISYAPEELRIVDALKQAAEVGVTVDGEVKHQSYLSEYEVAKVSHVTVDKIRVVVQTSENIKSGTFLPKPSGRSTYLLWLVGTNGPDPARYRNIS